MGKTVNETANISARGEESTSFSKKSDRLDFELSFEVLFASRIADGKTLSEMSASS